MICKYFKIRIISVVVVSLSMSTNCILQANTQNTTSADTFKNAETVYLFNSLKALSRSDYMMFGVANGLTISYSGGPKHEFTDKSDTKDITGSHPAFIESDFMWYDDANFKKNDTIAMRTAFKRGAVTGYCWHLRGKKSSDFYAYKDNVLTADKTLVTEILADTNRTTNTVLNWYLTKLDKEAIPIFKGLGFPMVFRPFHEMTGSWFWWGTATCTNDEYIKLFRLTVDYLRAKGVKNLLYAWAPDKSGEFARYPGDDYVDVIGYDGYDVGIESYHQTATMLSNLGSLSTYALAHDKILAFTETGHGKYPTSHPDYWLKHILEPVYKNKKARNVAWIMTWYNADWSNNGSGTRYIPYTGIEKVTEGQNAIDDFMAFYNHTSTLFMDDMPPMYINADSSAYIYPTQCTLTEGDSLTLLGGMRCNWLNDSAVWKSDNTELASVTSTGKVKALKAGTVVITVTASNGKNTSCSITIEAKPVSVKKVEINSFKIFPNPVKSGARVSIDLGVNTYAFKTIELTTIQGQRLKYEQLTNNEYFIEPNTLCAGIYLVTMSSEVHKETARLVVE